MATNTVNARLRPAAGGTQVAVTDLTISNPQVSGGFVAQIPAGASYGAIIAGDMVFITTNYGIASLSTPGTSNANAAAFCGVAADTYPIIITDQITAGFPTGTPQKVQYWRDGIFRFHTTVGDTYHFGDSVYLGADGQTVQKTATGRAIGTVAADQRDTGGQLGVNVIGALNQDVSILISPAI